MRFAVVVNGVVDNVIVSDVKSSANLIASDTANIGDTFDGVSFSVRQSNALPVPKSVTMRQARLALHAAGLLSTVETAIAGAGVAAGIEWEYAQTVDRAAGLVPEMAIALGMTESQIDALFVAAAAL